MVTFFRRTHVWVVDFTYEGRPRRWFKPLPQGIDAAAALHAQLADLYGAHARLVGVRPATEQEEIDYVRGNVPKNMLCPTGRAPRAS